MTEVKVISKLEQICALKCQRSGICDTHIDNAKPDTGPLLMAPKTRIRRKGKTYEYVCETYLEPKKVQA